MSKVVLGGGISGLSAAYYLRKKFPLKQITLIEVSNRTGGWIKSIKQEAGYIFEQGPRTIRPKGLKGANTLQLVEELGLDKEIVYIPSKHPASLNRMIYVNGQLHSLPSTLIGIFKTQSPFSKPLIRYLTNDLRAPQKIKLENDESIYSFVQRRFGKEVADYAISPLICGICAGDAKHISVKFLMEELFNYEQSYGNIVKGIVFSAFNQKKTDDQSFQSNLTKRSKQEKWNVFSFKDGLEVLPKKLEKVNKENGVEFRLNTRCTKISVDNKVTLHLSNGSTITTDHLISCIPSKILADLLDGHNELKQLLKSIPFVNVGVINLRYKSKVLNKEGFGFLIPPLENIPILGVIFDSCCFPHGNDTVLTVMMGGHWFKKYFGNMPTEDYLLDIALNQLKTILSIEEKPASYQINILNDCIPQYIVGHNKKMDQITNYIKVRKLPLSLCGASYKGVGINDVIFSAKTTVNTIEM